MSMRPRWLALISASLHPPRPGLGSCAVSRIARYALRSSGSDLGATGGALRSDSASTDSTIGSLQGLGSSRPVCWWAIAAVITRRVENLAPAAARYDRYSPTVLAGTGSGTSPWRSRHQSGERPPLVVVGEPAASQCGLAVPGCDFDVSHLVILCRRCALISAANLFI